ncbi:MAG: hypothetical protein KKC80_00975 [Candidatus Margulisbacteria bacterium]|nr:hypothetical protein [Candidatus Margulisiibacteriota bacterium]MBU1616448.1 hypothetical protein [Candidatus Margulisiibacteriota bacterium]
MLILLLVFSLSGLAGAVSFNVLGNGITIHGKTPPATTPLSTPANGVRFYLQTGAKDPLNKTTGLPNGDDVEIYAYNPDNSKKLIPSVSGGVLKFKEDGAMVDLSQTTTGKQYVQFNDPTAGSVIYAMIWDTIVGKDGYYLVKSFSFPTGNGWNTFDPTTTWDITGQTNNKATVPSTPLITKFSDSLTSIVGDGTESSLTAYSAATDEADGSVIPISKYSWKYGTASPPTTDGPATQNMTLTNPSAGTYYFQVTYYNDFGDTSSKIESHIYSGGGAGGPLSYPLTFESQVASDGPGINFFSMPIPPDKDGKWYAYDNNPFSATYQKNMTLNGISNAYELLQAINSAAKTYLPSGTQYLFYTSSFGQWKSNEQKDGGVLVTCSGPGLLTSQVNALKAIPIKQGVGYQVYIGKNGSNNPPAKFDMIIKNTQ